MNKEIIKQETEIEPTANIDGYIALRQEFIAKVNTIMVNKKDYHIIQGRKSLAKGGAEKIASIFKWRAKFDKDTESVEMLGGVDGLVAFKCTLTLKDEFIGEGRGATTLSKNAGDPNKTLKMAQKSAFIDAVLRASGLSDFFTQDLEDMNPSDIGQPSQMANINRVNVATEKQKSFIMELCLSKGVKTTQEELNELTSYSASKYIERLKAMPNKGKSNAEAKAVDAVERDINADLENNIPIINAED